MLGHIVKSYMTVIARWGAIKFILLICIFGMEMYYGSSELSGEPFLFCRIKKRIAQLAEMKLLLAQSARAQKSRKRLFIQWSNHIKGG